MIDLSTFFMWLCLKFLVRISIPWLVFIKGFPGGSDGKNLPAMQETWVQSLGWEDPLENTPVSWPRDSMDCMGSQRVGHN